MAREHSCAVWPRRGFGTHPAVFTWLQNSWLRYKNSRLSPTGPA